MLPSVVLTAPVAVLGGCSVVMVALSVLAFRRQRAPGTAAFGVMALGIAFYTATYAVALSTPIGSPPARLFWERVMWFGIAVIPIGWFVFAVEYTGHEGWLDRRVLGAVCIVPVVGLALLWVEPIPHLWRGYDLYSRRGLTLIDQQYTPLFWTMYIYELLLMAAGTVLLLRHGVVADGVYRSQTAAFVVGASVPAVANVVSIFGYAPYPGLDMTPYAFALTGLAFGVAILQEEGFDWAPASRHLGQQAMVQHMTEAVVLLDHDDRVVDANPAAAEALFEDGETATGVPVNEVLPAVAARTDGGATQRQAVVDDRVYEVSSSPVTDHRDRELGHVLVLTDVTERHRRDKRLSVLNRVLRHNVRNDVTIVAGYAQLLEERAEDDELASTAADIRDVTTDIVTISKRARELQLVLDSDNETTGDLAGRVTALVSAVRSEYPAVTVESDVPARAMVPAPDVCETVVQNLLVNAAAHNTGAEQLVSVTFECEDDTVRVVVADDGPGIPSSERAPLSNEAETPLDHGSGLGLWVVNWGVHAVGGGVTFDTGDDGTVVTVTLPRVQVAADDDDTEDRVQSSRPADSEPRRDSPASPDRS
ncbi:histidine kinase N-terminal 7TM domain-containing protein [Haloarchaeobius sp. DT45]|uniref:histidine kinase N-terminal 7TM domain-containing protein n=1 Tax=Haloarchaeobius sp. DT45 TaxID=3446116 RepID=UPI003F6D161E